MAVIASLQWFNAGLLNHSSHFSVPVFDTGRQRGSVNTANDTCNKYGGRGQAQLTRV